MQDPTQPNWASSALVTVDFQQDVLPEGSFSRKENGPVLVQLSAMADTFRKRKRPIVHMVRIYLEDGSNADLCRREKLRRGLSLFRPKSRGVQLAPELLPPGSPPLEETILLAGDIQEIGSLEKILYKPRFGSFYRTPLETMLRDLQVDTLIVGGSNYPNCPRTTLYEASERDFRLVALSDALSLFNEQDHRQMKAIGARVMSCKQVTEAMKVKAP